MPVKKRTIIRAVTFAALVCGAGAARVEAAGCSISSTSVVFGGYNVFTPAPVDTTGTLTYRCNGSAKSVLITISAGQAGSTASRALAGTIDQLQYNLYRDAARSAVWGDGSGGAQALVVGDPPNNTDITTTIYGRIPAGQDVRAGSYSDHVTIVVNF